MYRKTDAHQLKFENFYLPFDGTLRRDNRWVILAGQIPRQAIEQTYGRRNLGVIKQMASLGRLKYTLQGSKFPLGKSDLQIV